MRDNHDGLIELVEVFNSDNIFSCTISLDINKENLRLCFSIVPKDYVNLLNILQFRPFENTGVAPYRYFFLLSYQKKENNIAIISMRVEQLRGYKNFKFEVTQKLIANLLWFDSLTDKELAKDMIL